MVKQNKRRHAFLLADAITGIVILGLLLSVFAGALGHQHAISSKLSDARIAWRNAEAALSEMQAGRQTKLAQIRPLPDGNAPAGFVWVEAVAKQGKQQARLIGLVPQVVESHP